LVVHSPTIERSPNSNQARSIFGATNSATYTFNRGFVRAPAFEIFGLGPGF
jgi:hypothetical protein